MNANVVEGFEPFVLLIVIAIGTSDWEPHAMNRVSEQSSKGMEDRDLELEWNKVCVRFR